MLAQDSMLNSTSDSILAGCKFEQHRAQWTSNVFCSGGQVEGEARGGRVTQRGIPEGPTLPPDLNLIP